MITVQFSGGSLVLPVKVTPKGGRDCLLAYATDDLTIKLKVSSPPEDGKANAAVIALLASLLKLPKSRFKIMQGEKSRQKRLAIIDSQPTDVEICLSILAQEMGTEVELAFLVRQS